jgi:cytochrome c-type biogenesis protein CcmF
MAFGPLLAWKRADFYPVLQRLFLAGGVAAIVFLAVAANRHIIAALGLAGGAWVLVAAFTDLAQRVRLFRIPLRQSAARFFALPRAAIGAAVGHIGFGVTVLGIAGMTLAAQTVVVLQPGQSARLGGYVWTLTDVHAAPGPNYAQHVADVTVADADGVFLTLHPSRRFFAMQKTITNDAAIHTNGFQDLYAVFADEPPGGGAELRLNYHPMAPEIWLGGLIMACGGFFSLSDRRLRVGAPSRKELARKKAADAVAA